MECLLETLISNRDEFNEALAILSSEGVTVNQLLTKVTDSELAEIGVSESSRKAIQEAQLQFKGGKLKLPTKAIGESRYNKDYFCRVFRAERLAEDIVAVFFEVQGDGSLGPLQDPTNSSLLWLNAADAVSDAPDAAALACLAPSWSRVVPNMPDRKAGRLVFRLADSLEAPLDSLKAGAVRLWFRFGSGGYSTADLGVLPRWKQETAVSRYNGGYFARVLLAERGDGEEEGNLVWVHLEVRGDGSLGPLQDARASSLWVGDQACIPEPARARLPHDGADFKHGTLAFRAPGGGDGAGLGFSFGSSGYSRASLRLPK